jgi:uncharacterized protein (TIGR01777 family)
VQVAMTGSSGLIGSMLASALEQHGHQVVRLVRRPAQDASELSWDPSRHQLDPSALAGVDAIVHLAGAGIGDHRWTGAHRDRVLSSRIDGTTTVSEAIARAQPGPGILLSASAVGWYGDTGDQAVDEAAPAGSGFLAEVCRRWEDATAAAERAGVRVVRFRTGLVCSPHGGLLGRLLPLFKLGLGGRLGSGRQYWSWISLADEVAAIRHLLETDISGPVNLTGPLPVTNAEFTKTLGHILQRPTLIPVPRLALRIAVGEFADEGIVAGQRVLPRALERAGYTFQHATAEQALRWATGRP